eukprot:3932471-Rhodomonas_salina.1
MWDVGCGMWDVGCGMCDVCLPLRHATCAMRTGDVCCVLCVVCCVSASAAICAARGPMPSVFRRNSVVSKVSFSHAPSTAVAVPLRRGALLQLRKNARAAGTVTLCFAEASRRERAEGCLSEKGGALRPGAEGRGWG